MSILAGKLRGPLEDALKLASELAESLSPFRLVRSRTTRLSGSRGYYSIYISDLPSSFWDLGLEEQIDYLVENYWGLIEPTFYKEEPWGREDYVYKSGEWILAINERLGYASLSKKV